MGTVAAKPVPHRLPQEPRIYGNLNQPNALCPRLGSLPPHPAPPSPRAI
jgi:hypothetical protein